MFLSYQRFLVRWRSLGESNPCFSLERAAFRDGRKQQSFQKPGETPTEAAGHGAFCRSFGASDAVALLRLHQPFRNYFGDVGEFLRLMQSGRAELSGISPND
jgi:hypothetical protein